VGLLAVAVLFTACTTDGDVVGVVGGEEVTEAEIVESLDEDGDGVVRRLEVQQAVADLAISDLLTRQDVVAATFPGGDVTIGMVLTSLEEQPPSNLATGAEPDRAMITARLTSMVNLRLAAVGLTDLGFPASIDGSDIEINNVVAEILSDPAFEVFATEETVRRRPEVERVATPHCLSVLTVGSESEAIAARDRVEAGEDIFQVALEVNISEAAPPGGSIGCNSLLDWSQAPGLDALALQELEVGGLTSPSSMPFEGVPNGELWLVFRLDDLQTEALDLASLGPFASSVIREQMASYEVEVDPAFGVWNSAELSIGFEPRS